MKKIFKIISSFLFFLLLMPTYSQTIQFSGVDNNGKSKIIDSIRIQNFGKHIDTLLINTTSINLSTITSVNQFNESNNFEVSEYISSENPLFVIRTSKDLDISIIISDILGKIITQNKYFLKFGENNLSLDLITKVPGLYLVTFKTYDKIITKKFIITEISSSQNESIQNSKPTEKHISIESDDVYNFIGYSRYCIPDTIRNIIPKNNENYQFLFNLDTNTFPIRRLHLEINLPNTVIHNWWHYSTETNTWYDTLVFKQKFDINISDYYSSFKNDIITISSNPYYLIFYCDYASYRIFEFNFDEINYKINYFRFMDAARLSDNNSNTEKCFDLQIIGTDFKLEGDKFVLYLKDKELRDKILSKNIELEYKEKYTPHSTAQFGGLDLQEILNYDENSYLKITLEK